MGTFVSQYLNMIKTHQNLNPENLHHDPTWRQRVSISLLFIVSIYPLLTVTEFKPWALFDSQSAEATWQFLISFFPPKTSLNFLWELAKAAWITIAIATCGMVMALILAIPLALVITNNFSVSALGKSRMAYLPFWVRQILRWLLVTLRSIPELVFALLLVRIVGLGPTAGVLAIMLAYTGMLAKVYAEILESSDRQCSNTLLKNGVGRLQTFLYSALPQCGCELVSYTIYRWECAIRSASVMGMVGAGGLGQYLDSSIKMMAGGAMSTGNEVSTILLVLIILVACADYVSSWLRKILV